MVNSERRPTIIDVAHEAGVSKSTVSLVLQNSPQVKDETRLLVREAMARVGYVYNRAAANLRTSSPSLIGLVINDLKNPFFTEFATALQMALSARGCATVIANTAEDPALQAQVVKAMIEHGVAALVISPTFGEEAATFDTIASSGIPAMQVLRKVVPDVEKFPLVAPDYMTGGRLATEHLLAVGAKRIAFVGGLEGRSVTLERMSGYLEVLAANNMEPLLIQGRASRTFGREAAHLLATEHPDVDAALCFNDLVALGLMHGCAHIGRQVGAGFRIVGFDDIEECAETLPSLSSVRCDIEGFGKSIADKVLAWLEDGVVPDAEKRTPVTLVVRESSAAG